MSLLRYQSWPVTTAWSDDLFRLFDDLSAANTEGSSARHWQPRVDIVEHEDHYALQVDLPGVNPESVDITLEDHQLTLSGERAAQAVSDGLQRRLERPSGHFSRSFRLPESADVQNINARSEHGVVHISIAKRSQSQAVKISIAA